MTDFPERMLTRSRQLQNAGMDFVQASGTAWLEERIRQWPAAWGDDLHVLIYGDFLPPEIDLQYPSLGITVLRTKQENTVIRSALTVLEGIVTIPTKTVPSVIDASRRLNLLLGIYMLYEWGNAACGWWSWITHDHGGGVIMKLPTEGVDRSIASLLAKPPEVRRKLEAALFWLRHSRVSFFESQRMGVLSTYASYWNAFECLTEAIHLLRPPARLDARTKQAAIDKLIVEHGGTVTAECIQQCYHEIVNPGFVGKASHAIRVCFGSEQADGYIQECFRTVPKQNRLYNIRNAINHGEIDADNVEEILRVQGRLRTLWIIVWGIFGRIVPFPTPVDSQYDRTKR